MISEIDNSKTIEQLKNFLSQFENGEKLSNRIDQEVHSLKIQLKANTQKQSIDDEHLNEMLKFVLQERKTLCDSQNDLKIWIQANEIKDIQLNHDSFFNIERKSKLKRVYLFDNFFASCVEIDNCIISHKKLFEEKSFSESQLNLIKAQELYQKNFDLKDELFPHLVDESFLKKDVTLVLQKFNLRITIAKEEFIYNLIKLFKELFYIKDQTFIATCTILLSLKQYESYIKCVLQHEDVFKLYFRAILDFFNIENILENKKLAVIETTSNYKTISFVENADNSIESLLNNLLKFCECILELFTFNYEIENSVNLVQYIGNIWTDKIMNCVLNYFDKFIPKVESEFEDYLEVFKKANIFENQIKLLGILNKNHESILSDYLKNIKTHFSSKICQDFLIRMKKILKEQSKNTVLSDQVLENISFNCESKFAVCLVSEKMILVRQLIEEMSALLSNSSNNLKILLTETINSVCELFIIISPYLMKDLIETDSKMNAVFHNDCLFFGHLIESIALVHKPLLDSLFELVPVARNIGSKIFLNQMKYQEKTLLFFIENQVFSNSLRNIADEIPSTDLKISSQSHYEFRECLNNYLKHLNLLKKSFFKVLPEKMYNKVFSTLICVLLNRLVECLLSLNDISSLGSSHLSNEIEYFNRELKLFLVDSDEVVYKWMKLNEINFLFKSSMLEILNRWADGKGILATYLSAEEVKSFIRALFQNNERRSIVLAKIK